MVVLVSLVALVVFVVVVVVVFDHCLGIYARIQTKKETNIYAYTIPATLNRSCSQSRWRRCRHLCVCVCARVCVRVCVRACVCVCVSVSVSGLFV